MTSRSGLNAGRDENEMKRKCARLLNDAIDAAADFGESYGHTSPQDRANIVAILAAASLWAVIKHRGPLAALRCAFAAFLKYDPELVAPD